MINRREFLKQMLKVVAAVGASNFISFDDLNAAEYRLNKPNIVWLHASSCSGCSTSFLDIEGVALADILTKYTNIIYHPDISLATGHQVKEILNTVTSKYKGNYIFVLEGSIPTDLPHACMFAGEPMMHWIEKISQNATACVSAGTCASFGGITDMDGMFTGPKTFSKFLDMSNLNKPVINLPGCPMKPEHLLYVIFHYAKFLNLPELDRQGRPKRIYGRSVHETCVYYSEFQEKSFAKKIGDRGCLLNLGCQGPVTKNDCMLHGHNGNINTCIKAGHPCVGCASEHFPRQKMIHSYMDKNAVRQFKRAYIKGS